MLETGAQTSSSGELPSPWGERKSGPVLIRTKWMLIHSSRRRKSNYAQGTLRKRSSHIQVTGLTRRLEHIGKPAVAIGRFWRASIRDAGALIGHGAKCSATCSRRANREKIRALTMPGFGTTGRTRGNAIALMNAACACADSARSTSARCAYGIEMRCSSVMCLFGINLDGLDLEDRSPPNCGIFQPDRCNDLTFENIQARARTNLLMNTAFVVGTGDLSELALGWCTYNADHMSMYNPNVSAIPKNAGEVPWSLAGWRRTKIRWFWKETRC